jgi:rRNA maturation protein Nop10
MTLDSRCQICGMPNRLVGIEPHHAKAHLDIWTLECTHCGSLEARSQPASFSMVPAGAAGGPGGRLN